VKAAGVAGIERGNVWKTKLMSLQQAIGTRTVGPV
jgi:hypothetical protein